MRTSLLSVMRLAVQLSVVIVGTPDGFSVMENVDLSVNEYELERAVM